MQLKIFYQFAKYLFLLLFSATILHAQSFEFAQKILNSTDYFRFYTTNNIDIQGDVARYQGDDFNTGTLLLEIKKNEYIYGFNFMVYTQSNPEFGTTQRVDVIEQSFGKVLYTHHTENFAADFSIFEQLIVAGNFGGDTLQSFVHKTTKNSDTVLPYSTDRHMTLGLGFKADSIYYINIYINMLFPIYRQTST